MTDALAVSPDGAKPAPAPLSPVSLRVVLSALPGIVLILTEIWLTFGIFVWAVGGLLVPGWPGLAIAAAIAVGPCVVASWKVPVLAITSEYELAQAGY